MDSEEAEHLRALTKILKKRLHVLEEQAAQYGLECPPHIQTEIAEIKERIATFERQIGGDLGQLQRDMASIAHELGKVTVKEEHEYRFLGVRIWSVVVSRTFLLMLIVVFVGGAGILYGGPGVFTRPPPTNVPRTAIAIATPIPRTEIIVVTAKPNIITPVSLPRLCPTSAEAGAKHLGSGRQFQITLRKGCYYHFNLVCAGCGAGEEDNVIIFYNGESGDKVEITSPEGSAWEYGRAPTADEVGCTSGDRFPRNLPQFLRIGGVIQVFPCG